MQNPGSLNFLGTYPTTTVTPFTYREGATMLHIMEKFKNWAVALGPEVQEIVDEAVGGWQKLFDDFMADIVGRLEALNDQAVSNLVDNKLSLLRAALDRLIEAKKRVTTTLEFYIAPNGSDSNDGLTPGSPRKTINKIIADTQNDFYAANVEVIVNVGAGQYSENVRFENMTGEIKTYRIRGPRIDHPSVPFVVFTQGLGSGASGFLVRNPALNLIVEYIKFYGYDGNASAGGIVLADAHLTTNNVHAERCYWGITASRAHLEVPNGVFTNNGRVNGVSGSGAGVRSLMLTNHAIGNQYGSVNDSVRFTGNIYGVLAQESSVGHVDYCTFTGNDYGLVARVNSRANAAGSVFTDNVTAITSTGNSHVLISSAAFPDNSNGTNIVARSGGITTMTTFNAYLEGVDSAHSITPRRMVGAYSRVEFSGPSEYVFERILKAGFWNDNATSRTPAKKIQVRAVGTVSGTTATKNIGVRLGVTADGSSITQAIPANVTGALEMVCEIVFRSPDSQYLNTRLTVGGTVIMSDAISTVSMNVDRMLRLSLSTSSSQDVFVLNAIEIYVEG